MECARSRVAMGVSNPWRRRKAGVSSPSVCDVRVHIGCCDSSPSQNASKNAATTGHPIVACVEPGEDWLYDYEKRGMIEGGGVASATFAPRGSTIA
jgi:hypothetical protein